MGYGVHIERTGHVPINIEEWIEAVEHTENVRLADVAPITITNPMTGEQISRPYAPGNAEIFEVKSQAWVLAFSWFEGRISTRAARDFDNYECCQRSIMRSLAAMLNAQILGDGGEIYD